MMDVKITKDKLMVLIERTSSMLDEMNQKLCLKRKKVINRGKRNRSVRSVLSILV